jgi:hypothetical protein
MEDFRLIARAVRRPLRRWWLRVGLWLLLALALPQLVIATAALLQQAGYINSIPPITADLGRWSFVLLPIPWLLAAGVARSALTALLKDGARHGLYGGMFALLSLQGVPVLLAGLLLFLFGQTLSNSIVNLYLNQPGLGWIHLVDVIVHNCCYIILLALPLLALMAVAPEGVKLAWLLYAATLSAYVLSWIAPTHSGYSSGNLLGLPFVAIAQFAGLTVLALLLRWSASGCRSFLGLFTLLALQPFCALLLFSGGSALGSRPLILLGAWVDQVRPFSLGLVDAFAQELHKAVGRSATRYELLMPAAELLTALLPLAWTTLAVFATFRYLQMLEAGLQPAATASTETGYSTAT